MKSAYFEVPSLTKEEFEKVNNAESTIEELKLLIPKAVVYMSVFCYNDELYHTDTNGKRIEKLYHEIGKFINNLPIVEKVIEIPTGVSENLLIRAIAAASHQTI